MLNKNYWKDTFDLAELNVHNGIEHDASLTSMLYYIHPPLVFSFGIVAS